MLIKTLYHCPPSELDNQDARVIDMHRAFMLAELEDEYIKTHPGETRIRG